MPSEISDAAEGITKGTLSWGEDKIKTYAKKLLNGKLGFIQDQGTIDDVKEQLRSGEWSLYQQYIKDGELRILVQTGLVLRKYEHEEKWTALQSLREKIRNRFLPRGLHIAQFVQANTLQKFIGNIADKSASPEEIVQRVENLLQNLSKYTIFIQQTDDIAQKIEEIRTRIYANSPESFIIFTAASAVPAGRTVKDRLEGMIVGYDIEVQETPARLLIILTRKIGLF